MQEASPFRELASILASAVYARAASALSAGIDECVEVGELKEQQRSALVKSLLVHYQGLELELEGLMESASQHTPTLVADLGEVARARSLQGRSEKDPP